MIQLDGPSGATLQISKELIVLKPKGLYEEIVARDDNGISWICIQVDYGTAIYIEAVQREYTLHIVKLHYETVLRSILAARRKVIFIWVQGSAPRIDIINTDIDKPTKKELTKWLYLPR